MTDSKPITTDAILDAVSIVKNRNYQMYKMMSHPEKTCQWCSKRIDKLESFCSKECQSEHEAALADYESRREERERVNRAK